MEALDPTAARAFLRSAFQADDTVAVFLKSYATGAVAQRIVSLQLATSDRFLAWLRARNAARWNIYVGVNPVDERLRSRSRHAILAVRHLFVETDANAGAFLAVLADRSGVPQPSYLLRTSPGRVHVLWRVLGISVARAESVQKELARDLGGDMAATSCSQLTRIPGFVNRKRTDPFVVSLLFGPRNAVYGASAFPSHVEFRDQRDHAATCRTACLDRIARATRYLEFVPPAVSGKHGDQHTFRVCCRIVRGFDLDDETALAVLSDWNARCEPPWSASDLRRKVQAARRYGQEPFGGRLGSGKVENA
jgi:hypothetical protein